MALHPKPAHWFETYVPRQQTVYALEALAATGQVELEKDYVGRPLLDTRDLRQSIEAFRALAVHYADILPDCAVENRHIVTERPEATARDALAKLRTWLARYRYMQHHLHRIERQQHRLALLRQCISIMGDEADEIVQLGMDSRILARCILACPLTQLTDVTATANRIVNVYIGSQYQFVVILTLPGGARPQQPPCEGGPCEAVAIPDWLTSGWSERDMLFAREHALLAARFAATRQDMQQHAADPTLRQTLTELSVLAWYLEHTVTVTEDHRHCYVTGWTTVDSAEQLQQVLSSAHIDAPVVFSSAPRGSPPPVSVTRGPLLQPFRQFVEMLGTPASSELDPTVFLAFLVPVLFGLMFPDVGHGLLLASISLVIARRLPAASFLLPCGLSAALFGFLFGETFGLQYPEPALLPRPLDNPLLILAGSLLLGAAVILLGLALSGVEAYWRGTLRHWLWQDGAVLVMYVSSLAGLFYPDAWFVSLIALFGYLAGLLIDRQTAWWHGLGRLVHSALELLINTISFARVGAFALAHVALSGMLSSMISTLETNTAQVIAFVVGHLLIVAVEGFIVVIQTTRLVLFEFFIRFLRADGRLFRPLQISTARR